MLVMLFSEAGLDVRESPPGAPLLPGGLLTAEDFCPPGLGACAWSDARLSRAYDRLAGLLGFAPPVRYGFRRPSDGLHRGESAHMAGLALDLALPERLLSERPFLLSLAREAGFDRIEPAFASPTWLHVECFVAAAARPGFPRLSPGDRGVHVLVLQDLLAAAGFYAAGLTGLFHAPTAAAVLAYRRARALPLRPIADAPLWALLTAPAPRSAPSIPPRAP